MTSEAPARTSAAARGVATRARRGVVARVMAILDGGLEWAIASFAAWTVLDHASRLLGASGGPVLAVWVGVSVALAVLRVVHARSLRYRVRARSDLIAVAASLVVAGASALIIRPDADDASYVVRSEWVASHGLLHPGDVIFSDGHWPGMAFQTPYVATFEDLLGMLARATGLTVGSLTYLVLVPLASFAACWALWTLVRAWHVRRPAAVHLLAITFLVMGGGLNASWGNLWIGRLWQGKVVLLAVVVPLAYAFAARAMSARSRARQVAMWGLLACASAAAVGLSPAGVFVFPEIVVVVAVAAAALRRWRMAAWLAVAGLSYPLVAGAWTVLAGAPGSGLGVTGALATPWRRVVEGVPAVVAAVAALVALVGLVVPRLSRTRSRLSAVTAGLAVLAGALLLLTPVYRVAVDLMGTDAIAWRTVWVVPLPVVVGMLAAPVARGRAAGLAATVVAVATAGALVLGGTPIWSADNGVVSSGRPAWRIPAGDLATARWIVAHPPSGMYAAPLWVVVGVGVSKTGILPAGSRLDYIELYDGYGPAQVEARRLVQGWIEGTVGSVAPDDVRAALDELDVDLVCVDRSRESGVLAGWVPQDSPGPTPCWRRA